MELIKSIGELLVKAGELIEKVGDVVDACGKSDEDGASSEQLEGPAETPALEEKKI